MATKFFSRFKIGAGINGRRAFRAYRAQEYESMFDALKYLKPSHFISSKEEDMTILHDAAYNNDLECIEVLTELPYFEEIVNDNSNKYEWTPVLWAASKQHLPAVKRLMRHGANPLKPKSDGITTLHVAATNNDVHLLDYLLAKAGNHVNIQNGEGWTPAHFAAFMGNYDSLNLLIENKADLWIRHDQKMNVFEEIVRSNDDSFLEGVYNIYKSKPRDTKEEGGYSLLHLAAGADSFKTMKYLIAQGEKVTQIGNLKDKATPLHFAVLSNNYAGTKFLLKGGASANQQDSTGNTAYHFAVSSKNQQLMKMLEISGGDATIENDAGISPLDHAGIENIKSAKLYFMTLPKYKQILQENAYI